jgi:hypothetical protein
VVEIFGHLVAGYPDPPLRAAAADAGRVLVGRRLELAGPGAGEDGAAALLRLLPRLDPGDRLLAGDAHRFSHQQSHHQQRGARAALPLAAPPSPGPRFALDAAYRWCAAAAIDGGLLAAGVGDRPGGPRLALARIGWNGNAQYVHWDGFGALDAAALEPLRLSVQVGGVTRVRVFAGRRLAGERQLAPIDGVPGRVEAADIVVPGRLGEFEPVAAAAPTPNLGGDAGVLYLLRGGMGLLLSSHRPTGGRAVLLPLEAKPPFALALLADHVAAIADGCLLGLAWPPDGSWDPPAPAEANPYEGIPGLRLAMLDLPALDWAVAPDGSAITIAHADGASVHAPRADGWQRVRCGQGLARPAIGYACDGTVAVADLGELRRYRCDPPRVELRDTQRWSPPSAPVAIVAGPGQHQVAVLLRGGGVMIG